MGKNILTETKLQMLDLLQSSRKGYKNYEPFDIVKLNISNSLAIIRKQYKIAFNDKDFVSNSTTVKENEMLTNVEKSNRNDIKNKILETKKQYMDYKHTGYSLKGSQSGVIGHVKEYAMHFINIQKRRLNKNFGYAMLSRETMRLYSTLLLNPHLSKLNTVINPLSLLSNELLHISSHIPGSGYSDIHNIIKLIYEEAYKDSYKDNELDAMMLSLKLKTFIPKNQYYYALLRFYDAKYGSNSELTLFNYLIKNANIKYTKMTPKYLIELNNMNTLSIEQYANNRFSVSSLVKNLSDTTNGGYTDYVSAKLNSSNETPFFSLIFRDTNYIIDAKSNKNSLNDLIFGKSEKGIPRPFYNYDNIIKGSSPVSNEIEQIVNTNKIAKKFISNVQSSDTAHFKTVNTHTILSTINKSKVISGSKLKDLIVDDSKLNITGDNTPIVPFSIYIVNSNKTIILPSTIESYTDSPSTSYDSKQPLGKATSLYTYTNIVRTINVGIKLFPINADELKLVYQKINTIVGLTYPFYNSDGYPETPIIKVTLGNLLKDTYCILNNITTTYDMGTPWENQMQHTYNNEEIDVARVPKNITLNLDLKPIGNELLRSGGKVIFGLPDGWVN